MQTELKMFRTVKIDADEDGDNDISVKYSFYPTIERPLKLSINYQLIIKRLDGFQGPDAYFEAYAEYYFPGLFNKKWGNDRVSFGYKSEQGEEVPDECKVIYRFIPNLLRRSSPEHKLEINPGNIDGKDNISLIYSHAEMDETLVLSEKRWDINLEPAVVSEILIGGSTENFGKSFSFESSSKSKVVITRTNIDAFNSTTFGLIIDQVSDFSVELQCTPLLAGGGKIEYERISSDNVDITLFIESVNSTY